MTALAKFTFVSNGKWRNEKNNTSIMLDEDYKRTYRAYLSPHPDYHFTVKNKKGNDMRFRSAEAAARYLSHFS